MVDSSNPHLAVNVIIPLPEHLQMTDVPCTVTSPFESPLISAHLEKLVTSSGCVTNNTNPETGAEVHVIRFHGKLEANVELRLEDPYKTSK
ncbi:hypothetical protein DPMN_154061 [Dreissena polymorpha]|uniref:Uncharacterized protein n=1 Tax=Dreissena polymorpha TaxID=45954 RepID=A0A9D4FNH9_DREPO|nr:hypothetical protein DPMN_154061 [Dreissena polymorpha]